ncbi:MAG: hypothetical protein HWN67_07670 [Candidatus Helarchaeota archaeon]|nr:hypothetical protein [Candidatus Helarchaeota archaeon]
MNEINKPYFLSIINPSGICLFLYSFKEEFDVTEFQLFSGFITAIIKFSEELTEKIGYRKEDGRVPSIPLNLNFEILISYNGPLIGCLVAERKDYDEDMKIFLNEVLNEFLEINGEILKDFNGDIGIFDKFKDEIERIFRKTSIFSYQIPKMRSDQNKRISLKEDFLEVINLIDSKKDIKQISQILKKGVEKIKDMISRLLWLELINLSDKVHDDDVLEPRKDLFQLIRSREIDPEKEKEKYLEEKATEFELLNAIDGFKTVHDLDDDFPNLTSDEIKRILSYYLSQGSFLEKIELYPQLLNIDDKLIEDLPDESLALCYSLENICEGDLSLAEISERIGKPIKEIKIMLNFMGDHVTYTKRPVK